jgi:hypothetical protein
MKMSVFFLITIEKVETQDFKQPIFCTIINECNTIFEA